MNPQKLSKLTLVVLGWLMLFSLNASAQTSSAGQNEINKKPLEDFVDSVIEKRENNETDLTKSFSVVIEGFLTDDGKLDTSKSKFTKSVGDEDIVSIVKYGIEAIGESGFLIYLNDLGIKDFTLSLTQNNNSFAGSLTSNMKSENEAKVLSNGIKGVFTIAKLQKGMTEDDKNIIDAFKAPVTESSQMILQFEMPKTVFQEMIDRNLRAASEKRNKYSQM